ncbi:MAG: phage shock protein operon transcriptional activator [Rhodospirillales bacterium 20-60-12]|nr:MAG: phage shock protein operon transcriptional activator [Rhodospirillales bacterium 20-60-12]HQT68263.1 phage shock protein operon transcriptional activator [Acetobacteraceae bacterium]
MVNITNDPPTLIGGSRRFQDMLAEASRLAALNRPVLIIGERGTGKELVASRLALLSERWNRPFLRLNCAALSPSLLDAELFGYEAGAFTGAARRRPGRFEIADGGTIFLDEIANASREVQEKLLRVIEYGTFERVGGTETIQSDVRILAATNEDLRANVSAGRFRADLLDRLAFDVILLPALRERLEDIDILAQHFARQMANELKRPSFPGFAPAALAQLRAHSWPGNVRELKNIVERSVARMTDQGALLDQMMMDPFADFSAACAPRAPSPAPPPPALSVGTESDGFHQQTAAYEAQLLQAALQAHKFNQRRAADALGLSYDQLRHLLRRHKIGGRSI